MRGTLHKVADILSHAGIDPAQLPAFLPQAAGVFRRGRTPQDLMELIDQKICGDPLGEVGFDPSGDILQHDEHGRCPQVLRDGLDVEDRHPRIDGNVRMVIEDR